MVRSNADDGSLHVLTKGDAKLIRNIENKGGRPRSPQSHSEEDAESEHPDNTLHTYLKTNSQKFQRLQMVTVWQYSIHFKASATGHPFGNENNNICLVPLHHVKSTMQVIRICINCGPNTDHAPPTSWINHEMRGLTHRIFLGDTHQTAGYSSTRSPLIYVCAISSPLLQREKLYYAPGISESKRLASRQW